MSGWQQKLLHLVGRRVGLSDERLVTGASVTMYVRERVHSLGLRDESDFVTRLSSVEDEWPPFLNALVNGQTCFFRDVEQIEAGVSALAERQARMGRRMHVWSAGCSTGEEPYSLAILAQRRGVDVEVWGTDLNPVGLDVARRATYSEWSLRHMPDDVADSFLIEEGGCQVRPEVASHVRFARHNALKEPALRSTAHDGRWDLIFCRNVLIYYPIDEAVAIARRLADSLADEGLLSLGASEVVAGIAAGVAAEPWHGRVFYRRGERLLPSFHVPTRPAPLSPPSVSPTTAQEMWVVAMDAPEDVSLGPPRDFLAVERRVSELVGRGAWEGAVGLLEEVLRRNPADVMAALALGHVHLRQHAFEAALEMYGRVQERDPLLSEAHLFEGVTHRKRGAYPEARQALQRVLFLDPCSWPASYLLIGTLERLGKPEDAIREATRARRLLVTHGARATASSSLSLGLSLLPEPEACLEHLRAMPAAVVHKAP